MSRDEGHIAGPESHDDYEAAVLDFLDKEMAAVQPTKQDNTQSEELDALVSDLLKQVMTETDQSKDGQNAVTDDMRMVLSEFPPKEESPAADSKAHNSQVTAPTAPIPAKAVDSKKPAGDAFKRKPSTISVTSIFTPIKPPKSRIIRIAIPSACLLTIIGFASYYFSGSLNAPAKAKESPALVPVSVASSTQNLDMPDSGASGAQTPAPSKSASVPATSARMVTAQKSLAAGYEPQSSVIRPVMKPPASKSDPGPTARSSSTYLLPPPKDEMPAVVQPPPQIPVPASTVAPYNPSPPPMPDNIASVKASTEKKPAQPATPAPSGVVNPAPSPQTAPPAPLVAQDLVPAVPISQVSPQYPPLAIRTRTSAKIILDLQIDEKGRVVKATPVSGPAMFHQAAVSAALKWRYKPATIGGTEVPSQSRVTIDFNLK